MNLKKVVIQPSLEKCFSRDRYLTPLSIYKQTSLYMWNQRNLGELLFGHHGGSILATTNLRPPPIS